MSLGRGKIRFALLLWVALLLTRLAGAQEPLTQRRPIEIVTVDYALLPAGLELASAKAAGELGQLHRLQPGGSLPQTGRGEELWTRITWRNPEGARRWVAIELLDFFEDYSVLYLEQNDGRAETHLAGEGVGFPKKSLWGREPVFLISPPERPEFVTWINHGNDDSNWPLLRVHDPADMFLRQRRAKDTWTGFYYGVLLALGIYSGFVYMVLKWREVLYYLLYVTTFGTAFFFYQNLHFEWLPWLRSPYHNLLVALLVAAEVIALLTFSRHFLAVAEISPRLDQWMRRAAQVFAGIGGIVAVYFAAITINPELHQRWPELYQGIFPVLGLTTLIIYVALTGSAIWLWGHGCRQARFYLMGFGAVFAFMTPAFMAIIFNRQGRTGHLWLQVGSALEMLFFALALADKIRLMRLEKDAAVEKALVESAERTRLERAHEQILRQKDELAALSQQKSEFLGIAAHDLKTPLNALAGIAQLLREEVTASPEQRMSAEERVHYLGEIACSSQRMRGVIDSLLETEALESGQVRIDLAEFSLADVVASARRGVVPAAAAKSIVFEWAVPPDLHVRVDGRRFLEVLENVLGNAVKFTPRGGRVVLTADKLPVKPGCAGRIVLRVLDTGPGFRAEDMPKIFGRYRKLSARPTGGESSSGLGLYIARRLLELQGGSISLVSAPGESAVFEIEVAAA